MGEWEAGGCEGQGKTYANGDRYKGKWREGKRHRRGIFRYASGDKDEGEWLAWQYHGPGTYASADGVVKVSGVRGSLMSKRLLHGWMDLPIGASGKMGSTSRTFYWARGPSLCCLIGICLSSPATRVCSDHCILMIQAWQSESADKLHVPAQQLRWHGRSQNGIVWPT